MPHDSDLQQADILLARTVWGPRAFGVENNVIVA